MNGDESGRVVGVDDPEGLAALAAAVRAWEPRFELVRPPLDAQLYEPDGTLYAVCLAESMTVGGGHRERPLGRGDALVVPRDLAIEAGPQVDLLALRYDGPPPDHFRERFLQVWGFETYPAPAIDPARAGLAAVIPLADVRHRIPYAILDVSETSGQLFYAKDGLALVVGLSGRVSLRQVPDTGGPTLVIGPRDLATLPPEFTGRASGSGRLGVLTLFRELTHHARRLSRETADGKILSPEYRPTTQRPPVSPENMGDMGQI